MGNSCSGLPPKWEVDFWAGSHIAQNPNTLNKGAITRCVMQSEDGKECIDWAFIYSDEKLFDEYIAVHKAAIQKLYDDVLSKCEKWSGEPSLDILKR